MLHRATGGILMMIIVPTFSGGNQSNEPIVATVLASLVTAITKHVSETVHAPCDVPDENCPQENSPDRYARCEERGIRDRRTKEPREPHRDCEVRNALTKIEKDWSNRISFKPEIKWILKRVARISRVIRDMSQIVIAQEEPSHVAPQKVDEWRMWIFAFIAVRMVHAVRGNPSCGRILQAAQCKRDKCPFKPAGDLETSVSQKSVISHSDRLPKDVNSNEADDQSSP